MTELLLFLTPIIVVLNATYLYFWIVAIYAMTHKHIDRSPVSNREIANAAVRAKKKGDPYKFTIQITTKGGSWQVVQRGINHALDAVEQYPILKKLLRIEVITEDQHDIDELSRIFASAHEPINFYLLPVDYATPRGTKLKARALHYMVEMHRANPRDAYIVHYDEESIFTADNLARLVRNLLAKPVGISEGSISYPLEWNDAHIICRTMESNRPFGCHECYLVMTHPAPLHLHGSNLVIQERIENEIGWDIGTYKNHPLIAEDLVFGLMVFLRYGKRAFGWHGVEMLEQPPFTVKAAYKQRERWVMGGLQGVAHVKSLPGYDAMPWVERFKIAWVIKFRILTYAIGFPVSIISLLVMFGTAAYSYLYWAITGDIELHVTLLTIPGLIMWLGGTQLGLWQNLRYTGMTRWEKFVEHLKVLICSPFTGIYDTSGPTMAVLKWMVGKKSVKWDPTIKIKSQTEYGKTASVGQMQAEEVGA